MPSIPPGYAQVTWQALNTFSGQVFMTSIGVAIEAWDPASIDDVEALFWNSDSFGGLVWEGWVSQGCLVKVGTSDPSEPLTYQAPPGATGEGTASPSSPQVSVLYKKLTNRGGRRGRGRMYIPGPQEAWVNGAGQLEPDGITAYTDAGDTFFGNVTAVDGFVDPVLLHTTVADGDPNVLTSFTLETLVATQRRRLRG